MLSENAKDRTRLRRIQTALREKVSKNIKLINPHLPPKSKITEDSFEEGKFPWQLDILDADNSSSSHPDRMLEDITLINKIFLKYFLLFLVTFDEKYKLVNTWMLWNRYKEEIVLTKSEMVQHAKTLKTTASALEQKEKILMAEMSKESPESDVNTLLLGKVLLIRAEMDYISRMMSEAKHHFRAESEADILCLSLGLKGHEDIGDEEDEKLEKEDETDDPDSTAASVDGDSDSGSEDELDLIGSEDEMDIIEDEYENIESAGKANVHDDLLL